MEQDPQTLQNTKDISDLTNTVTKIATMFEYSEKSRVEERSDIKATVNELKTLNEKIGAMANVQKELSDLSSDVRTIRHDLKNVDNALQGMPMLKKDIEQCSKDLVEIRTVQTEITKWKDAHNLGAMEQTLRDLSDWKIASLSAVKTASKGVILFWAVFGSVIGSGILWGVIQFATVHPQQYSSTTSTVTESGRKLAH